MRENMARERAGRSPPSFKECLERALHGPFDDSEHPLMRQLHEQGVTVIGEKGGPVADFAVPNDADFLDRIKESSVPTCRCGNMRWVPTSDGKWFKCAECRRRLRKAKP
jgi:hypothetical protein